MAKNKRKNKIDPAPIFAAGDRIKHPKYGVGIVRQVASDNHMFPDFEFFYDVDFCGRRGDGTKVWLPKVKTEKECEKIEKRK